MKKSKIYIFLTILFSFSAFGGIGETTEECNIKYGKIINQYEMFGEYWIDYQKNVNGVDLLIVAQFIENKAVKITFSPTSEKSFNPDMKLINYILKINNLNVAKKSENGVVLGYGSDAGNVIALFMRDREASQNPVIAVQIYSEPYLRKEIREMGEILKMQDK